jgi:hypothetical protein
MQQEISMQNLPVRSLGPFASDSASRIYLDSLQDAGVTIPVSLRSSVLSEGSLFHIFSQDYLRGVVSLHKFVQDLLAAGFVHVDESLKGVTPLMTWAESTGRVTAVHREMPIRQKFPCGSRDMDVPVASQLFLYPMVPQFPLSMADFFTDLPSLGLI